MWRHLKRACRERTAFAGLSGSCFTAVIQCMRPLFFLACLAPLCVSVAQEVPGEFVMKRCEILPLANHEVSLRIDGVEKARWHSGEDYPRPFLFPFNGPAGVSLTRMGHPGAEDHDHHQSIWFAHHDVEGESYWSNSAKTSIRQKHWYSYENGDLEAVASFKTGWYNEAGLEMIEQDIVVALRPMENGEHALEIQTTLRPASGRETTELGKTNFGILAVRVSDTLSHRFGGGNLRNSKGDIGEKNIFGKAAKWMDYSGPVVAGTGTERETVVEGITLFDHPENPRYPSKWHVRSDGWMGSSFCMDEGITLSGESPLTLRYLLHAHRGSYDESRAEKVATAFSERPLFVIRKPERSHKQWETVRKK